MASDVSEARVWGTNGCDIDLVILEYSSFNTRRVKNECEMNTFVNTIASFVT